VLLFTPLACVAACQHCYVSEEASAFPVVAKNANCGLLNVSPYPEGNMSISSVPSSINTPQAGGAQSLVARARQDLKELASALQSGDLSGAKNDFSALMQLMQSVQQPSQSQTPSSGTQNKVGTDLTAIGNALQSGSLSSAQDAFNKLLQDMQVAAQGHHHHHHGHGAQYASNALGSSTGAGATDSGGSGAKRINATA
jgi:hypothetical protein